MRRDLGILKAVGFTGGTVVGEVLVNNAVVGVAAGMLAVLYLCIVVSRLGTQNFGQLLTVLAVHAATILLDSAAISSVVAAAVAWRMSPSAPSVGASGMAAPGRRFALSVLPNPTDTLSCSIGRR